MTLHKGGNIPNVPLFYLAPKVDGACTLAPSKIDVGKVGHPLLIVVVPGAFTPTCSEKHVPGFLTTTAIGFLKDAGIKQVLILSTDSPFITSAWGETLSQDKPEIAKEINSGYIKFVSDAGGEWLSAAGLVGEPTDLFSKNGLRGLRSAIIVNSAGHVDYVGIDRTKGTVEASGIQAVLKALQC